MTYQSFFPNHLPMLALNQVRLEPLSFSHSQCLAQAVEDGQIYNLLVTSAPIPDGTEHYIRLALKQREQGQRYAFAVIDEKTNQVIGSTSYYDVEPEIRRLKIGYTWYAKIHQRTHVNSNCKFLLLQYAFEVLNANSEAFETDLLNIASQNAIARLGAQKDGVLRGHKIRKDGTIRDTVVYSIIANEWQEIKTQLKSSIDCFQVSSKHA